MIIKDGGFVGDLFKNPEGGIYYELFKKFIEPHGKLYAPPAFIDGLNKLVRVHFILLSSFVNLLSILQLSMDDGAFFANKETVFSQEATKCDVLMPWETEFPNLLGMAVAKESAYYEMLMFRTLKQMDMGTWQVILSQSDPSEWFGFCG